jgi:hypothetical protein
MLTLERLEDRLVPDATLALAFQTQLAPALTRQHDAISAAIIREAEYVITVASAEAGALGPQFTAQQLPQVLVTAQNLLAFLPNEEMVFQESLVEDEAALYQLPPDPNELAFVGQTVAQLDALTGVLPF